VPDPARCPDVGGLTRSELERTGRELPASLALSRPDSPARGPILTHLSAIDAELAGRRPGGYGGIYMCSCGFGTDDPAWLEGHLFQHPGHRAAPMTRCRADRQTSPVDSPVHP
jgi:hypothetical protein